MVTFSRFTIQLLLGVLALVLIFNGRYVPAQANWHQIPTTTTLQDSHFDPEDWSETADLIGDTMTMTEQRPVAANPNHTARFTTDTFHAVEVGDFDELYTFHLFDQTYDPAVEGAITLIDYQEAHILESVSPAHQGQEVYGYLIIEQDGEFYKGPEFPIDHLAWEVQTQTNLQASQFAAHSNSTEGQHPDFSAQGAPMRFGYGRYQVRATWYPNVPADQDLIYEHAIDNWQVTLHPRQDGPNRPPTAQDDTYILQGDEDPVYGRLSLLANDSDPDFDVLTLTISQPPDYGVAQWNSVTKLATYLKDVSVDGHVYPDFFEYQISDGEFTDTATVTVLIDCTCAINCVTQHQLPFRQEGDSLDLDLIRRLRDRVMRGTTHGSRYVEMYYGSTPEIARILILTHTHLGDEAVAVTQLWQENIASLADGDGTAVITQAQVDALDTFLTNLSDVSSTELKQLIADERTRIGSFDGYVGMTMAEAKSHVLGNELAFLPLVLNQ